MKHVKLGNVGTSPLNLDINVNLKPATLKALYTDWSIRVFRSSANFPVAEK